MQIGKNIFMKFEIASSKDCRHPQILGRPFYHFRASKMCKLYVARKRRSTDFKAEKMKNSRSGIIARNFLSLHRPTNLFTILEPQDQEICEFCVVQKRRATDFDASKL